MNRTLQFRGTVYGNNPAVITAVVNGKEVFSGTVPISGQDLIDLNPEDNPTDVIFTADIPIAYAGNMPVNITVHSGQVLFAEIHGNYFVVANPVYTKEQYDFLTSEITTEERIAMFETVANPPLSDADKQVLRTSEYPELDYMAVIVAHNVGRLAVTPSTHFRRIHPKDCRSNVVIDGESLTAGPVDDEFGLWSWIINASEKPMVFSFDMMVDDCCGGCVDRSGPDWNNIQLTEYN
jgi:hypothetical protein